MFCTNVHHNMYEASHSLGRRDSERELVSTVMLLKFVEKMKDWCSRQISWIAISSNLVRMAQTTTRGDLEFKITLVEFLFEAASTALVFDPSGRLLWPYLVIVDEQQVLVDVLRVALSNLTRYVEAQRVPMATTISRLPIVATLSALARRATNHPLLSGLKDELRKLENDPSSAEVSDLNWQPPATQLSMACFQYYGAPPDSDKENSLDDELG